MRISVYIALIILLTSCTSKYTASHSNKEKFNNDVNYCIKLACEKHNKSLFQRLSIISSAMAYGGGGGGGGGLSSSKNKISYKVFNLCLKEKGYIKDDSGFFTLPFLSCN